VLQKNNKKILIICTAFAPKNVIGSVRMSKFSKYLVQNGWDITVITLPINQDDLVDYSLISNEIKDINIIRIPHSILYNNTMSSLRSMFSSRDNKNTSNFKVVTSINNEVKTSRLNKYKYSIKSKGFKLYSKASHWDWYLECRQWINKNLSHEEFDVVISSYPGIAAHWIANYIRKKKFAKKWVADFRDPMGYKELDSENDYKRKMKNQNRIVKSADAIIGVSKALALSLEKMAIDSPIQSKPVYYIPNGYDTDDYDLHHIGTEKSNDNLVFTYTGGLYGGRRNIEVIFKILKELSNDKQVDIDKVKFIYAGKDFSSLKKQAFQHGLTDILVDNGYITRSESLKLQLQSSLIVVCTWNNGNYNGVIPGKIYETLLINRPTIAIINGDSQDSEVSQIINATKTGFAYEEASGLQAYANLKQYILEQYINNTKNKEIYYPNLDIVEKYNYKNLTYELEKVLNRILENQN
jgi:glycosyltransferase involved in cell wall biosynthesis